MSGDSEICVSKIDSWELLFGVFGENKGMAEIFEISEAAVSQWKRFGIPKDRLRYLKLMRPDLDWAAIERSLANKVREVNHG